MDGMGYDNFGLTNSFGNIPVRLRGLNLQPKPKYAASCGLADSLTANCSVALVEHGPSHVYPVGRYTIQG